MTSIQLNDPYRQSLEDKATTLAKAFVSGNLGVTECVRQIVPVLRELELDRDKSLIVLFGVDSEFDGFPMGAVREHWNETALVREDEQRRECEDSYRADVLECCRYAIAKFEEDST
ncbi:MAG: DUF2489 domain-containing protein [Gammaproteobacteria bacterium]|nr:DUF2489 domain-containing protein [Gammaproteobacteria bacterium]